METTIKIEDYLTQEDIKEILKEKIERYVDKDIENTIKVAIKYAFHELIKPEYLEKLPSLVDKKLEELSINDIIGYASSYFDERVPARVIITDTVKQNKDKIAQKVLSVMEGMEQYDAKELCIEALRRGVNN
jgi:DNA integrity scanning protein DisA with diadenylate cyclase activity